MSFFLATLSLFLLVAGQSFCMASSAKTESFSINGRDGPGGRVPFFLYQPTSISSTPTALLLLIPGFNGTGEAMLDDRWKHFADQNDLVLLAPTFTSLQPDELHHNKGYYYPEQGSGNEVELALEEAHRRTGVPIDHILIFGFSAGAHFAHRFALWRPEQVKAFVAYSAAWWSDPTEQLRDVPALIMCGESDMRYQPSLEFMRKGLALHLPWIWRSYKNTGHELTPPVRAMSESFLSYYAGQMRDGGNASATSPPIYGNILTFQAFPASGMTSIPEEVRILLPSKDIADTWVKGD